MLSAMRKSASGFIAKIIILLLIAALGLWGVGDMVRGGGNAVVAEVGREPIYTQDFFRSLQILRSNLGENFTLDSMRQSQFPDLVLNELIDRKVLELTAKEMGIHLSDESLFQFIIESPLFRNEQNVFDKDRFIMVLRNSGMTEQAYMQETREGLLVNMLQDTALMHNTAPVALAEALFQAVKEQRSADLLLIDPLAMKLDDAADESELQDVYDEISPRFASDEQKQFSVLTFTRKAMRDALAASFDDEALRGYYETHIDTYTTPASRDVFQLTVDTQEEADAAYAELQEAENALGYMKDKGAIKQSFTQGVGLEDAVTDTVFALEENVLSEPIESDFGWQILYLASTQPAEIKPFEELKDRIKNTLIGEQMENYSYEQSNALEDAIAGGATLQEAKENLPFASELQHYDTAKGKQPSPKMLASTQGLLKGDYTGLQLDEDGLYSFIVIDEVVASVIPPLEEIRKEVVAEWKDRTRKAKAREAANSIADKLSNGEDVKTAIADLPVTQTFSGFITRNDNKIANNSLLKDKILTRGFSRELFSLSKGKSTGAYPLPSGEFVIGILRNIIDAPDAKAEESAEDLRKIQQELAELVPDEIYTMWMQQLRNRYEVTINQDVVNAVLSQ